MSRHLDGLAAADARLGAPFPLPAAPLPPVRWAEVHAVGERGVEVEWNLDDTRPGTPGRLVLYAGPHAPPPHALAGASPPEAVRVGGAPATVRTAPLAAAQASLRPVTEVAWRDGERHLRLTAQGPWDRDALLALAGSVPCVSPAAPV